MPQSGPQGCSTRTCDSLPTPDTGLRSVCPSARTASTATRIAITTPASGSYTLSPSSGTSTAVHSAVDTARPAPHQSAGIARHAPVRPFSSGCSLLPLRQVLGYEV